MELGAMVEEILSGVLVVHIAAGALALLAGLAAILIRPKGSLWHRRAGRAYVYGMAVIIATGVPLALAQDSLFLFLVAIFTGYVVFTGYRVLSRKRPTPGDASGLDLVTHWGMVVTGVVMIVYGGISTVMGSIGINPVLVVFGALGLAMARKELVAIRDPPEDPRAWFYNHIGYMGGAYIATVTAAATINLTQVPELARWLGPAAVGIPIIEVTTRRYRERFEKGQTPATVDERAFEASSPVTADT